MYGLFIHVQERNNFYEEDASLIVLLSPPNHDDIVRLIIKSFTSLQ